jgi:GNAT superfamily N-acetyltransferase
LNIQIRDAFEEDSSALSSLVTELGYPTTPEQMEVRLRSITEQPGHKTLIAEVEGTIVGMVGACIGYYYEHDGTYLRVLAMVTSATTRNKGIATALLTAVEEWGKEQGASSVFLNSGNRKEREAAHAFYLKRGFEAKSTGFVKKLP